MNCPQNRRLVEDEVVTWGGALGRHPKTGKKSFFELSRLAAVRQTYIVLEEWMVEAAGVEPPRVLRYLEVSCA
ncbi:MAG: hypothetical protein HOI66_21080 [Verrucomicrobia bacterium]|nr:hypothetical protein [Verrucomicrobiota bacterium]